MIFRPLSKRVQISVRAPGVLVLTAIAALAFSGCSTSSSAPQPSRSANDTVSVQVGRPVQVLDLRYTLLNPDKPFQDAVLLLLDNGSYRIVSDGEDHWGSYITNRAEAPRTVAFMSWPSKDWDNDVAQHVLEFGADGSFSQHLTLPGGEESDQSGTWQARPRPEDYDAHTPATQLSATKS